MCIDIKTKVDPFNPQILLDVPFHITAPRGTCLGHARRAVASIGDVSVCVYVCMYVCVYMCHTFVPSLSSAITLQRELES